MKIGIGFVTGRKSFRKVFRTYVNSWNEHGLIADQSVHLQLFVAYDLSYFGTSASNYKNLDSSLIQKIDGISFYGKTRIAEERAALVRNGVLNLREAQLLFGDGYGKKRNAVMWFAIRAGMDRLIFIDDDEYPLAVSAGATLAWYGQSVIGSHIKYSSEADITHGRHCGYISPIPRIPFNSVLTEESFAEFIESISNDIVSWEKIRKIVIENDGVTYADHNLVGSQKAEEVPLINGSKFISGANLCLNIERGGADSPFFNPPGARGEDTFLATCLESKKVLRIPVYTFHDGFLRYESLLNGVLPQKLKPVDASESDIVKRFAKASVGWVRYKPLLVYITNRSGYEETIESMRASLKKLGPKFKEYFGAKEFSTLNDELNHYDVKVEEHFEMFMETRAAWAKARAWAKENPL